MKWNEILPNTDEYHLKIVYLFLDSSTSEICIVLNDESDDECVCIELTLPQDMQFHRQVSEAIRKNKDVEKSVILLQERIKNTDTVARCIKICDELLTPVTPDFSKLVKDYMLDE